MACRKLLRLPCQVVERTFKLLFLSLILTVPLPTDRLYNLEKHPNPRKGRPFLTALHTLSFIIALSLLVPSAVAVPAIVTEVVTVQAVPTNAVPTNAVASKNAATKDVAAKDVATKEVATKEVATKEVATKEVATKDISKSTQYDDRPSGKPCGKFEPMTNEIWENGMREKVTEWMRQQKTFYEKNPGGTSFANYLLEKFFPSSARTVKSCNLMADCHYGSCHDLDPNIPHEEQQLALYAAENLANLHQGLRTIVEAIKDAAVWVDQQHVGYDKTFTWLDEYRADADKRKAREKLRNSIILAVALMVTGIVGGLGSMVAPLKDIGEKVTAAAIGSSISTISAMVSAGVAGGLAIHTAQEGTNNQFFRNDEAEWGKYWSTMSDSMEQLFQTALLNYLDGKPDADGHDIVDILSKGGFHMPFRHDLVMQAQHRGDDAFYGLDLEDVVRSSFMNYRLSKNKEMDLKTTVDSMTVDAIQSTIEKNLVRSFGVAVCYNPGGEAFSSLNVFDGSMNYPCMCGDFPYKTVHSDQNDESDDFAIQSGLVYNSDWWTYCNTKKKKHGMECHSKRKGWNCKDKAWEKQKPAQGICDHGLFKNCVNWGHHKSIGHAEGWEKRSLSGHESEVMAANASIQLEI